MYDLPNRKQRRDIARKLGLLKRRSKMEYKDWLEETHRSQLMGKELHRQKTEENLRKQEEVEAEKNKDL